MDRHCRLPQNKSHVHQSHQRPTRTTVLLECPPNPTLVLHTPILISVRTVGKVVLEDGDTRLTSHTSHFTLQMSNAVNKL